MKPTVFANYASRCSLGSKPGFTILEVMVGVIIATASITVLIPSLSRQLIVADEASQLTAVEAAVTRDLDWLSNYVRIWKLKNGVYSLNSAITKVSSSVEGLGPLAEYEPDVLLCQSSAASPNGLARQMIEDAMTLNSLQSEELSVFRPPYPISSPGVVQVIEIHSGLIDLSVNRTIKPLGNRIHVVYVFARSVAARLRFYREASLLVEAAAWCDRLP
jgi:hypothetical protein